MVACIMDVVQLLTDLKKKKKSPVLTLQILTLNFTFMLQQPSISLDKCQPAICLPQNVWAILSLGT